MESRFEEKNVLDVVEWLRNNGISDEIADIFEENEVDGESLLEFTEVDIQKLVKPLGVVKKLKKLLTSVKEQSQSEQPEIPVSPFSGTSSEHSSAPVSSTPERDSASVSTIASGGSLSMASIRTSTDTLSKGFQIPSMWRPSIMLGIDERSLDQETRCEIVRDLCTHMYASLSSKDEKPSSRLCTEVATALVKKYPFMADARSSKTDVVACGSWAGKLLDRVYNLEKKRKRSRPSNGLNTCTPAKRGRPSNSSKANLFRYPPVRSDLQRPDEDTDVRNVAALQKEFEKEKPRKDVVIQLMKDTYVLRRQYVFHGANCAREIWTKYPGFRLPSVIEAEFELILKRGGVYRSFCSDWKQKWVPATLKYARRTKRKEVSVLIRELDESKKGGEDDDSDGDQKCVLKILCTLFGPKRGNAATKSQAGTGLNYVYCQYPVTDDPSVIAQEDLHPQRNAPWICELVVDEGESSYYLMVEKHVLCSIPSFSKAVFLWFATFYVFNLEYALKETSLFFQEFLFGQPDSCKKTSTYLSVSTDIQRETMT